MQRMLWLVLGVVVLIILARTGLLGAFWYGPHPLGGWMWAGAGSLFGPPLWVGLIGLLIILWRRDQAPVDEDPERWRGPRERS